jgi:TP901 family phage tail tape measure protein
MTRLEKLMFTVSMVDKASGPATKLQATLDTLNKKAIGGMGKITAGAAGLFSTGYALKSLLEPQREMSRAMGEVRSLDVSEQALKTLKNEALDFSMKYGESAADFVKSSYSIQSAIAGLTGNELASFTTASNILAKGTKSDAATITDYMGTMYGIFKTSADGMGKSKWVEQLSGQTALAVKIFKTTGTGMSDAFRGVGANAQSAGIAMGEQIAVLGTLQSTMPGAEAGTKYKAFLAGVGKAQGELGLKFTDSQGKMLPMVQILDKIKGKYGQIDTVAKADLLKKAFGSDEAVAMVKVLMNDTAGLADNITKIGNETGMEGVTKMAEAMTDPWDKLAMTSNALKIQLGSMIEPVLMPFLNGLLSIGGALGRFAAENPRVAQALGILAIGVITVIGLLSVFAMIGGIASLVTSGWGIATAILSFKISTLNIGMRLLSATMWILNSAFLANPITWIVLGIMALIGVVYLLVKHWDKLKQSFMDYSAFGMALKALGWIWEKLKAIMGLGGVDVTSTIDQQQAEGRAAAPSLNAPGQTDSFSSGKGLMQEYSSINKTNNGPRIDKVIINTQKVDDQNILNMAMSG